MEKNKNTKQLTITPYREPGQKRIYSNYIEISNSLIDISIKFCDIRPAENKKEHAETEKTGVLKAPIEAEVIIPIPIAKDFLNVLRDKLEKGNK